jgi:hypothetical protein
MINRYPGDIQSWIVMKGGPEKMPYEGILEPSGERAMEDGLSEVQRLIDPEARQWRLLFIPADV